MALVMYERLERYDELTGAFKGAHVKLFDTSTREAGDAMSYATAAGVGFTQTDILTQIEIGAITAADTAVAALNEATAEIAALKAQIAALQKPV